MVMQIKLLVLLLLCLHSKSGSHVVLNITLSNFTCLMVDFGKVSCSSANELPQDSNSCLDLTFAAFCLLSVIRKQ